MITSVAKASSTTERRYSRKYGRVHIKLNSSQDILPLHRRCVRSETSASSLSTESTQVVHGSSNTTHPLIRYFLARRDELRPVLAGYDRSFAYSAFSFELMKLACSHHTCAPLVTSSKLRSLLRAAKSPIRVINVLSRARPPRFCAHFIEILSLAPWFDQGPQSPQEAEPSVDRDGISQACRHGPDSSRRVVPGRFTWLSVCQISLPASKIARLSWGTSTCAAVPRDPS